MLSVNGYEIADRLYEANDAVVYRGVRPTDGTRVFIKVAGGKAAGPHAVARLRRDFDIAREFDAELTLPPLSFEEFEQGAALILADDGSRTLREYIQSGQPELSRSARLALRLVESLAMVHAAGVIHKNINPDNILVPPDATGVRLIAFGIAGQLPRERSFPIEANRLEVDPVYIAPEQSGRTEQSIDRRADLYSLGVVFYELFTGRLPFPSIDPDELVRLRGRGQPAGLRNLNPELPQELERIVLKLLAYMPGERYRGCAELAEDLRACIAGLSGASIELSSLRVKQTPAGNAPHLLECLFGREEEMESLRRGLREARAGRAGLHMIVAPGGGGKTGLVRYLRRQVDATGGIFLYGKFDQFRADAPYRGFVESLAPLFRASPGPTLRPALGPRGASLVKAVPELEGLLGPPGSLAGWSPAERRDHFRSLFRKLLRYFAKQQIPLVLCLDDLHHADAGSLRLLEGIQLDPEADRLMLVATYAEDAVQDGGPLAAWLERCPAAARPLEVLRPHPLSGEDLREMIAELAPDAVEVAGLLLEKTGGNPLLVHEFLNGLALSGRSGNDPDPNDNRKDGRPFATEAIKHRAMAASAPRAVGERLAGELGPELIRLLGVAAQLGYTFSLADLALVEKRERLGVAREIEPALRAGFLLPANDACKFAAYEDAKDGHHKDPRTQVPRYEFAHDFIQAALVARMNPDERSRTHARIARELLRAAGSLNSLARLFEIAGHLRMARSAIVDEAESMEAARLSHRAGREAAETGALEAALVFLRQARDFLPADAWDLDHDFAFRLHLDLGAMEHANLGYEGGETHLRTCLERVRSDEERAHIHELRATLFADLGRFEEAIDAGLEALRLMNLKVPVSTVPPAFPDDLSSLLALPEMTRADQTSAMRVLARLLYPALVSSSPHYPALVADMVRRSLEFGNSPQSAYAYVHYAVFACTRTRDYSFGYALGRQALALQDRRFDTVWPGRVQALYGIYVHGCKHRLREGPDHLRPAYEQGLLDSDPRFAAAALFYIATGRFMGGMVETIPESFERIKQYRGALQSFGIHSMNRQLELGEQFLVNLSTAAADRLTRSGEAGEIRENPAGFQKEADLATQWLVLHLEAILAYVFGKPHRALKLSDEVLRKSTPVVGTLPLPLALLINCLIHARMARVARHPGEAADHQRTIRENLAALKEIARQAPQNYRHYFVLARAELAALRQEGDRAVELFEKAIEEARRYGFVFSEALGCELSALHYRDLGKLRVAGIMMNEAREAYSRWGAGEKTKDLEKRFPELLGRRAAGAQDTDSTTASYTDSTTMETFSRGLDMDSVMKAAQAISVELVEDRLLDQLIRIILENAGAERVLFFRLRGDELWIEAMGQADESEIQLVHVPADRRSDFAESVVNYCIRSGEHVLLHDAAREEIFGNDPYIVERAPRSMLCLPIQFQNRLTSILYMENNVTSGAFSDDRLQALKMLAGQIAISMAHATLYGELEAKVEERTRELRETQSRLLSLEKEATERQMAGGFAHEMRNALAGSRLLLEQALGMSEDGERESLNLKNSRILKDSYLWLKELLEADADQELLGRFRTIFRNEERLERILKIVYKATDRGLQITQQIMSFSRIGQEEAGRDRLDLARIVQQFIADHETAMAEQGILLELEADVESMVVEGLENHFYSVINNLTLNARDALLDPRLPPDRKRRLSFRLRRRGDRAELRIQDNALGIDPELLPRIYEAFVSSKPETGTGLGLATVKKIVLLYRGDIDVDSIPGSGTAFTVWFPAARRSWTAG